MLLKSSSWSIWPSDILSLPGPGDRMKGAHEGRKDTEATRRTEAKEKIKSQFASIWNS